MKNSNQDIVYGSVKNKIVSSDLLQERSNMDFHIEGGIIFKHMDYYVDFDQWQKDDKFMENDPVLRNSHEFYEMTREE